MKKGYVLLLLLIVGFSAGAQNYQSQIDAFRKAYIADFLSDKNSPLKKDDLQYLQFYNADSTYRVIATYQLLNSPKFEMPAFSGSSGEYLPYALVKFTIKGKQMQLTVYRSMRLINIASLKDYLLLLFTDETNGKTTYGGGRYIDMREGDFNNDHTVVIDFNKAYNPSCAFSAGYTCPKPPEENHLTYSIQAGEKIYGKGH